MCPMDRRARSMSSISRAMVVENLSQSKSSMLAARSEMFEVSSMPRHRIARASRAQGNSDDSSCHSPLAS